MPEDYGDFDDYEQEGMNIGWVRVLSHTAFRGREKKTTAHGTEQNFLLLQCH